MKYKLPHFSEIDLSQLEEHYRAEFEYNGQKTSVDLNFEGKQIESNLFDSVKEIIENIKLEDYKNRTYISNDFENINGDTVKEYLEFHIEELEDELSEIMDFNDKSNSPEKQLLDKLKLGRVGFYPDGKYGTESFVVFDYIVDREFSDQIIVVNIDHKGNLINLA